mgnify:CR=1 FL=1
MFERHLCALRVYASATGARAVVGGEEVALPHEALYPMPYGVPGRGGLRHRTQSDLHQFKCKLPCLDPLRDECWPRVEGTRFWVGGKLLDLHGETEFLGFGRWLLVQCNFAYARFRVVVEV